MEVAAEFIYTRMIEHSVKHFNKFIAYDSTPRIDDINRFNWQLMRSGSSQL